LNAAQLAEVAKQHRVSILSSRNPPSSAVIRIPGEAGLFATTRHLTERGHTRIGHIGLRAPDEHDRLAGYERGLKEAGLPLDAKWVRWISRVNIEAAYTAAKSLLTEAPEITAVSCYNDLAAIGTMRAAAELGRLLPDDLAITGFDDTLHRWSRLPSTTIRVSRYSSANGSCNCSSRSSRPTESSSIAKRSISNSSSAGHPAPDQGRRCPAFTGRPGGHRQQRLAHWRKP
jgi:DNA-binding LacI/PurR family transcriptional regulator